MRQVIHPDAPTVLQEPQGAKRIGLIRESSDLDGAAHHENYQSHVQGEIDMQLDQVEREKLAYF